MIVIQNKSTKISEVLRLWDVEFGDNLVNDICDAAGIPNTLVNGEIHVDKDRVYPARNSEGVCFKDEIKFHSDEYGICYVPYGGIDDDNYYDHRHAYCRADLYNLVDAHLIRYGLSNDVNQLTEELFDSLNWQFPESIIDKWSMSLENENE